MLKSIHNGALEDFKVAINPIPPIAEKDNCQINGLSNIHL
jgi:hypothetical protein